MHFGTNYCHDLFENKLEFVISTWQSITIAHCGCLTYNNMDLLNKTNKAESMNFSLRKI